MESTGIEYPPKTKIRHKTQNVNAKHLQCQCLVSGRSSGPSSHTCIFDIYLFFSEAQFEKTSLESLEQSLYLCTLGFLILITAFNYQLIIHFSNYCLMPVAFYRLAVSLRGGE